MKLPDISEVLIHYPQISGIHPAAELFPIIGEDDFAILVKDIRDGGLMNPILLNHENKLIDGRSRLLACYEIGQEIRIERTQTDPYVVSISANLARRHLDVGQRARIGAKLLKYEKEKAKARQQATQIKNGKAPGSANIGPTDESGRSRDKVAKTVHVGKMAIDKAVKLDQEPDLASAVDAGTMNLETADRLRRSREAAKPKPVEQKPDDKLKTEIVTHEGKVIQIDRPKRVLFNKTNNNVDWADYTWNPVTGCNHGCPFCYAREISGMERMKPFYPVGFTPVFHEYRLDAPKNTPVDGRVFVCSMADLFGKWVPDEWIDKIFDACMEAPQWEYMFLTKWPKRYKMLEKLPRAWFGSSIIKQSDVARVERDMCGFATEGIKWISLEPMLEPIVFKDLSWCDLIVIGSQTAANGEPDVAPEFDWVVDVINQCRMFNVKYYLKPNLMELKPGMKLPRNLPQLAK